MLKAKSIGTSPEFKPIEDAEAEVSFVELVTELIEVELQELALYVVVCVKYVSLRIIDRYMYP